MAKKIGEFCLKNGEFYYFPKMDFPETLCIQVNVMFTFYIHNANLAPAELIYVKTEHWRADAKKNRKPSPISFGQRSSNRPSNYK